MIGQMANNLTVHEHTDKTVVYELLYHNIARCIVKKCSHLVLGKVDTDYLDNRFQATVLGLVVLYQ